MVFLFPHFLLLQPDQYVEKVEIITLQNSIVVDLELFYIVLVRLLYSKWFYPLLIRLKLKSNLELLYLLLIRLKLKSNLELLYLLLISINLFFSLASSCLQIASQSSAPRVQSFIENIETWRSHLG